MSTLIIGIYTLGVVVIWAVYLIIRLHALKFRNYSGHVAPVTNMLGLALLVLTIVGYFLVFTLPVVRAPATVGSSVQTEIY